MKPRVLYSVHRGDSQVLTIQTDGTVSTRYVRPDGVLHLHRQRVLDLPDLLGISEEWECDSVIFEDFLEPPFSPPELVALRRRGDSRYALAIPFASLTDDDMAWVHTHFPQLLFLASDGVITCARAEPARLLPPSGS